jgi:hypothetical protein
MRSQLLTIAIVLGGVCGRVSACYCDPANFSTSDTSVRHAVNDADFVFRGKVQSQHVSNNAPGGGGVTTTFAIQESGKGPEDGTLEIGTVENDCRFNFENGEEYLIYAFPDANGAFTTTCTRSRSAEKAAYDLEVLRNEKKTASSLSKKASSQNTRHRQMFFGTF